MRTAEKGNVKEPVGTGRGLGVKAIGVYSCYRK